MGLSGRKIFSIIIGCRTRFFQIRFSFISCVVLQLYVPLHASISLIGFVTFTIQLKVKLSQNFVITVFGVLSGFRNDLADATIPPSLDKSFFKLVNG